MIEVVTVSDIHAFLEGMSPKGCEEKGQFVLDVSTAGAAKEAH